MHSAKWMAEKIDQALQQRKHWILPEPVSRFGSLLWRIEPSLYLHQVRKRFKEVLR